MSRLIDADKLIKEMSKWYWDKEKQKAAEEDVNPMDLFTHLAITTVQEQPTIKMKDVQDDIANILYNTLNYMYCDNCHRKYNGWGISMYTSNEIAKEILKRLEE